MRSYFAVQENKVHQGGWGTVLEWARRRIQFNHSPIKLFSARAGDTNARVIAEVTPQGERTIQDGRVMSLKAILSGKK